MSILKRSDQEGFTLIELMLLVAVIGVLSAVAVLNFKRYQAKSKTAEAKIQLAAAYTAEQVFYSYFEIYTTCLSYMGYHPVNEKLNRYYTIGFNVPNKISDEAFTMAEAKGMYTESDGCLNNMPPEEGKTFFSAGKYYVTEIAKKENMEKNQIGDQRTEETQTFTIEAVGVIGFDYGNTDRFSRLAIDQAGTIRVESPGY